jgi:hypothetical protein
MNWLNCPCLFSGSFSISSLTDGIDLFSVFVLSHKALMAWSVNGGQDQMWVSLGPGMIDCDHQCRPALVDGMMLLSCGASLMPAGGSCCSHLKSIMSRPPSSCPARQSSWPNTRPAPALRAEAPSRLAAGPPISCPARAQLAAPPPRLV